MEFGERIIVGGFRMSPDDFKFIISRFDKIEKKMEEKFQVVDDKIDTLLKFKWQIIGGSIVTSFFITFLFNMFKIFKGG